jgi:hypothetical protein
VPTAGVFGEWQPLYADRGIATFPVIDKRPAVGGYLKIGLRASCILTKKFAVADGIGFACGVRSGITVLDVDSADERLLADVLDEFGQTPFIVRSGSGNHQAWYRHSGERRRIRPDASRPIDILGGGFVVAPPSRGAKSAYTIMHGCLDDLRNLPALRVARLSSLDPVQALPGLGRIAIGRRNDSLWRACMKQARDCPNVDHLMRFAMQTNQQMLYEPLSDAEVLRIVASAWAMETSGENLFGRGGRIVISTEQIDELLKSHPDAFILLTILRRHHWGRDFVCANAMATTMPGGGWPEKRFAAARRRLEEIGEIDMVRPASRKHGPSIYRFKGRQK